MVTKEKSEKKRTWTFWRTYKRVPAVIWDPDRVHPNARPDPKTGQMPKGMPLCEFINEVCVTSDPKVAKVLRDLGCKQLKAGTRKAPHPKRANPKRDGPDDFIHLSPEHDEMQEDEMESIPFEDSEEASIDSEPTVGTPQMQPAGE
jgi:hypothetical protein